MEPLSTADLEAVAVTPGALEESPSSPAPSKGREEAMLVEGAIIGRLYRVLRLIGRGAQGEVYEVEHVNMGTRFAAKVLNREFADDPELLARLQLEARTASQLDHPNIARVVNFDTADDGRSFVVMELLLGDSLETRLARGPMSPHEVASIGADVAAALQAAHALGVVHRDVKPANVFLAETSVGRVVKVMDFGIAKVQQRDEDIKLTRAGTVVGTPAYMAPEQISGAGVVDHRADIYALGGMLFEMLTGRPPFVSATVLEVLLKHVSEPVPSLRQFRADVPLKLEGVVRQCLAKEPEHRFASMEAVAAELRSVPTGGAQRRGASVAPGTSPPLATPPVGPNATLPKPPPPTRAELGLDLKLPDTTTAARSEAGRNLRLAGILVALLMTWFVGSRVVARLSRPPPPRVTVSIAVTSEPMGAQVWLRDRVLGVTPCTFPLRFGAVPMELDVKLPGHEDAHISLVPSDDQTKSVTLKAVAPLPRPASFSRPGSKQTAPDRVEDRLPPRQVEAPTMGYLSLVTDTEVEVYVDKSHAGSTPIGRLELAPGRHEVLLRGRKGETRTLSVSIEIGAESTYNLSLGWGSSRTSDWEKPRRRR